MWFKILCSCGYVPTPWIFFFWFLFKFLTRKVWNHLCLTMMVLFAPMIGFPPDSQDQGLHLRRWSCYYGKSTERIWCNFRDFISFIRLVVNLVILAMHPIQRVRCPNYLLRKFLKNPLISQKIIFNVGAGSLICVRL